MRAAPLRLQTLIATLSFSGAALSTEMAWLHARSLHLADAFCGIAPRVHCGWCVAATALALTGAAALVHGGLESRGLRPAAASGRRPK